MQIVIFLNKQQKRILDEANIPVEKLTIAYAREIFTETDFTSIMVISGIYCSSNNLLTKYGFISNNPVDTTYDEYHTPSNLLNVATTVLDAACPDVSTIIIWEVDAKPTDTNNMLQHNISKILTAMLQVHTYEVVKNTKQFEICIIQLNNIVNDKGN